MAVHLLRFRPHTDASSEAIKIYQRKYIDLSSGDLRQFEPYLAAWIRVLSRGKVGTKDDRTPSARDEGGIGTKNGRQIRIYMKRELIPFLRYGEVTLRATPSPDGALGWTLKELINFGHAFKAVLEADGVGGVDFYIAVCIKDIV